MAAKPETTFTASVNRKLPRLLHKEKMNNPYRSGTPDFWYSGSKGDLWVEYKFIPKLAIRVDNKVELSELQRIWLNARHAEGRNVAVIVGHPDGGVVLQHPFPRELATSRILCSTLTRQELADWILSHTGLPL